MELNKQFKITYYAKKHGKHITRNAKWTELCRYWTSKLGDSLITYFDMDKQEYRTAKKTWTVTNTETRY
jgi:hypothetical protein